MAEETLDKSKTYFQIYAKLSSDILKGDPEGLSQQLLDGFLNIPEFKISVIDTATQMQREDIADKITSTPTTFTNRNHIARRLMQAVDESDTAMLVDLLDAPDTPILSLDELDMFWNVVGNMTAERETGDAFQAESFTHIQADPRYLAYFDQYVSAHGMSGPDITALRETVVTAHEAALTTINTIPYDAYQMELFGMSQDLYAAVESGQFDILGEPYTQPAESTLFTGLVPPVPLSPEALTVIKVPFNETVAEPEPEPAPAVAEEAAPADNVIIFNFASGAAKPEVPQPTTYKVVAGDNLWNIAKDTYGLTEHRDIMRAVDHIAYANGLEKGVDANWVRIGQDITLPTAEQVKIPTASLDWNALDRNIKSGTGPQGGAYVVSDRIAAAPSVL